jgi:uncharacterized protein (DUF2342 family)
MSQMVDWDLAVRLGSRLAGEGPEVGPAGAADAVTELRAGAERSTPLVRDFTGLEAGERTAPVLVVDRAGWVQANADGFRNVIDPLVRKLSERKGAPSGLSLAIGSRVTGAEVGVLLGFLGGKVLGQFDPFHGLDRDERGTSERPRDPIGPGLDRDERGTSERPRDPIGPGLDRDERGTSERPRDQIGRSPAGRLLLVAPNIVHVERELGANPTDFRLWVCLHEETHRVQFTAVPWMRDHLFAQVQALADTVEPGTGVEDLVRRVSEAVRGGLGRSSGEGVEGGVDRRGAGAGSLLDLMGTPEQKEILDRVTGMMSLLEGHADVVMDGVGPAVIPSVARIRRAFDRRRHGVGTLDRLMRRLLGLDAKMAQYRDGAAFVRHVVDKVGMADFNAVWAEPAHLPSRAEIDDPDSWVARVHG